MLFLQIVEYIKELKNYVNCMVFTVFQKQNPELKALYDVNSGLQFGMTVLPFIFLVNSLFIGILYYGHYYSIAIVQNAILYYGTPNYSDKECIMYMTEKSQRFPVVLQEVTNILVRDLETLSLLPIFKLLPICCS